MKILLDENIDIRTKLHFPANMEVYTVKDMGWNGIKNGELIQLLSQNSFDYWIVVDKNIPYQQNTRNISFTIIVLDVFRNTLKSIEALLPKILELINKPALDKVIVISEP
jgi:predicted nuclease of predicted toxin-antitoxin system